ncbi:MAG: phosphoribosylpyrophosphate synthetase [Saprospiraceae bacterium]
METLEQYDTLTQAIEALRLQGYTEDFNLQSNCIECRGGEHNLSPDEFRIDKVFRFYGANDPADESVLYAISSIDAMLKGVLVNGYGATADELDAAMIQKLN